MYRAHRSCRSQGNERSRDTMAASMQARHSSPSSKSASRSVLFSSVLSTRQSRPRGAAGGSFVAWFGASMDRSPAALDAPSRILLGAAASEWSSAADDVVGPVTVMGLGAGLKNSTTFDDLDKGAWASVWVCVRK